MNKRIALILFGVFVVGAAAAAVGARWSGQSQKNVQAESEKKEEATAIQEGQMTEKQRQHGKLFKHSGSKLRDIAARQTGDVEVEEGVGLMMRLPATGSQRPVFHSAVCNADAVVI
jgi:type II secretory pathway pseudopilin PulG